MSLGPAFRHRVVLAAMGVDSFDYVHPEPLPPGQICIVPLGPREVVGVVWDHPLDDGYPLEKLKPVNQVLDFAPFQDDHRRYLEWAAKYYMVPLSQMVRMAVNPHVVKAALPQIAVFFVDRVGDLRMTPARSRVIDYLRRSPGRSAAQIRKQTGASPAIIKAMERAGALRREIHEKRSPIPDYIPNFSPVHLREEQADAAAHLMRAVSAQKFSATLLQGVTGSGKTETYFEGIAEALRKGRQTLVLLPEIALTNQWLNRFQSRFGAPPLLWHSGMTQTARRDVYRAAIARGGVVVGTRSALHLPFARLGLVIVDEEHDTAFKQEEGVRYNARDLAVVRAKFAGAPVVLVSATPSLETTHNVAEGRYDRITLSERHGKATLPETRLIDLRQSPPDRGMWISPPLREALEARVGSGEQSMLFLNRRGYAPLTLCRSCGFRLSCPQCTAWLVEHRFRDRMECHHCGYAVPRPQTCPECGAEDSFVACGPGVERLTEEVMGIFPDARTAEVTSDTITSPLAAAQMVEAIESGAVDIIIGTQMIAKGYHFPALTLVGVIDGDLGLQGGDLRASERMFQQTLQVGGRAGRARRPGEVLIQTHVPDSPVMAALITGDVDAFLKAEANARAPAAMPPFGRLAALILSHTDGAALAAEAKRLARFVPRSEISVLGPTPAPLSMVRGRHRVRFLIHSRSSSLLIQPFLAEWLGAAGGVRGARLQIDIDPYSFL
ncbi:MAG: primosomal protein N' [Pseudomonadota bacterium]